MKWIFMLPGFLVLAGFSFAQTNALNATGNVGIGTTSPSASLHVQNSNTNYLTTVFLKNPINHIGARTGLTLENDNNSQTVFYKQASGGADGNDVVLYSTQGNTKIYTSGIERFRIGHSGNVGIGVSAPVAKLDVAGNVAIRSALTNASSRPAIGSIAAPGEVRGYSSTDYQADDGFLRLSAGGGTTPGVMSFMDLTGYSTIPDMSMNIVFGTVGTERMRISNSGNVGIGTATPTEKLSVNGKIRAQEIKVELANWPDFVFAKDYKLLSLSQTEKHILEKGHLPGIPSAKEVEANGVELGEMNKKLLQKIEELTLHLIQKEKALQSQDQRIQKLEDQIKKISNRYEQ